MNIVQKLTKCEISLEDCVIVQGGSFNPGVQNILVQIELNRPICLVEEAEKPDDDS